MGFTDSANVNFRTENDIRNLTQMGCNAARI